MYPKKFDLRKLRWDAHLAVGEFMTALRGMRGRQPKIGARLQCLPSAWHYAGGVNTGVRRPVRRPVPAARDGGHSEYPEVTMQGPFGIWRRRRRPNINITPLIDVMFLLLIFFMVSSTFRERLGIDITLPESETATEQETGRHEISVGRDGRLFFDGARVTRVELRGGLVELLAREPAAEIVLRADKDAAFQHVVAAMDIARDVGGAKLVIPTAWRGGAAAP